MSDSFALKDRYQMEDLLAIMTKLRSEEGCPWDREQTHESIRNNLIEETYEVVEAIDNKDPVSMEEELGDLLMQVVFHAKMEEEVGGFTFDDVVNGVCQKLIVRHPHIFGDVVVHNSDEVLDNWDEIKRQQKGQSTYTETLKSVPKVFPALMRSAKVQKRAAKSGFDYPDVQWAFQDLLSEVEELKEAIAQNNADGCFEELGDLLFSAVNVARFLHVDPEDSLNVSCNKFIDRFEAVERLAIERNVDMKHSSIDNLNCLWNEAKKQQ